ncbi:MAG: HAMP domain-containing histidine kinase [Arcicella sp.]|jgi:signal transduction histidine kinase|nr:HAMP domain-containing histidine kinase [Arcicella sp.]
MTIRTRLTLLFASIVSTLLLIFCVAIYLQSEYYRAKEFRDRLREEAHTSAKVMFGKEDISPDLLKLLDKNQMTVLNQEEIVMYDKNNKIVYESGTDYLTINLETLQGIRNKKEVYFRQGEREVLGTIFNNGDTDLVIVASALDKYGLSEQRNLGLMLAFGGFSMVVIVCIAGWFYAGRALKPIQKIIKKVDSIGASRLNLRLDEGNKTDEIAQLSLRFNQMLDRLENAFKLQRSFVSHASHELRTPLTAITGQIQVSLLAEDNPQELKNMIHSVLEDVQQLNRLTNNLLEMTSIDSDDTQINFSLVNVAELVWQVREVLLKKNPHYQVITTLDENPDLLPEVRANEALLYTVLLNLMENGVKFSPEHLVEIKFQINKKELVLSFHNDGSFIPEKEITQIFEPFRRGSNSRNIKGHGVGLSLTQKIVKLHKGSITVESSKEKGTTFILSLRRD